MSEIDKPIVFDTNILVKMREFPKEIVDKILTMDIYILREVFTEFKEQDSKFHLGLNNITQEINKIDKLLIESNVKEINLSSVNREVNAVRKAIDSRFYAKNELNDMINAMYKSEMYYNHVYTYQEWESIVTEFSLFANTGLILGAFDRDKKNYNKYFDFILYKRMIDIATTEKKEIVFVTNDKKETNDLYSKETILNSFKNESQQELVLYDLDEFIDGFLSAEDISTFYDNYAEFYMEYIKDYYKKYVDNDLWEKEYIKIELIDAYDSVTEADMNNIKSLFELIDFKYDFSSNIYLVFYVKAHYVNEFIDDFYIVFEYSGMTEINLDNILDSRKKGNEYISIYKIGGE